MAETRVERVGIYSAYRFAVEGGYTGTEEEFEAGLAASANYASNAQASAESASDSATSASTYASNASASASNASESATAAATAQASAETAQEAAEAAAQQAEETLEDYAKTDGYYEEMTVGDAEQLVATQYVEDSVPYLFRTTGGSADVGNREYADEIVGGTVAWNQLAKMSSGAWSMVNSTISFTNDEIALTKNVAITVANYASLKNTILGHKYFIGGYLKAQTEGEISARFGVFNTNGSTVKVVSSSTTTYTYGALICTPTNSGDFIGLRQGNTAENGRIAYYKKMQIIDLTQMFGSTIADYIYSLETANAGAGVAFFRKMFPNDYYEYNAGELISVSGLASHDTVGFNAFDISTGTAKVLGNNQYQITGTYTALSLDGETITPDSNGLFTPSANGTLTVTGGSDDTCVHLTWSGYRSGEYEEYQKHSYPLDSSLTLRGIPKLDSSNNLYYDGDTYASDGTVTRNTILRAYQSGDEELANAITDGTNTVVYQANASTEQAEPYQQVQICDDFGTEEFVSTSIVPVGHNTRYPDNLRDKLQHLPHLADSDGYYMISQQNNSMSLELFRIPKAPTTDGTYVLRASVSGGTPTYTWEVVE